MIAGVIAETHPGERRVAVVPAVVPALSKAGLTVAIESGAGLAAGFTDAGYAEQGAEDRRHRSRRRGARRSDASGQGIATRDRRRPRGSLR